MCARQRAAPLALLLASLLPPAAVLGDAAGLAPRINLLESLLAPGAALPGRVERIADADLAALLARARERLDAARDLAAQDDVAGAASAIAEGLRLSGELSRRAPASGVSPQAKARYRQLLQLAQSYRELFVRQRAQQRGDGAGDSAASDAAAPSLAALDSGLARARELAANDRFADAGQLLLSLTGPVEAYLSQRHDRSTIVYTLDLDSPEAAYQYELRRYAGQRRLLALVLDGLPAQAAARKLAVRVRTRGDDMQQRALQHAADGEFAVAGELLEKANRQLAQALRLGGVSLTQ